MVGKILRNIIFFWTFLSFLVDVFAAYTGHENSGGMLLILLILALEIFICWVAYQTFSGKRWALITLLVYYGLRTINIYTNALTYYAKTGLNLEVKIGWYIGVNVFTLIVFVLLIIELEWREIPLQ